MGPKNSAATCASVPSKDLSWIDRMYLKLENMCVEVDKNPSILLQETSKYMESHMNVVGANVKKLCTELIQDLISPTILSSEGAEKQLPECAIHCKCNCMDFEKPKHKSVDMVSKGSNPKAGHGVVPAKGSEEEEEKRIESIKGVVMKVETKHEEFATQGGQDISIEGSTRKSEASGKELNTIAGTDYGGDLNTASGQEELNTSVEAHETGTDRKVEELLSPSKGNSGLMGEDQDDSIKAYNKDSKDDESRMMGEEKSINGVACRGEVDHAEQASRPKEIDCQEFGTVDGQIAAHINIVAQGSVMASDLRAQEVEVLQQAVDVLHETHARRSKNISKICMEWHASHAMQKSLDLKIAAHVKMDASDAVSSGKNIGREEFKETNEVGGDLRSMYSYVFSELSQSNDEEDPMIMSDFLTGEDFEDEEQSAHWFDGEDLKKVLHAENFCIEKLRQTEGSVKEFDSDWELV